MKFGITVVTYNRISLLKECVDAIESQVFPASKVVVIDNASTDGTKEYLDQLAQNNTKYEVEHLSQNLGGSYGFYRGLEIIQNEDVDWILIIDDDAIINSDYLLEISKSIATNDYQAYSGTVKYNDIILYPHRKRLKSKIFVSHQIVPDAEYQQESFFYDFSSFCGLVVKRELVKVIGLPIKDYFIKFDDSEYSLRIRKYSKIMNVNSAQLNHKIKFEAQPKIRTCDWKRYYEIRNNINMGMKYTTSKPLYVAYILCKSFARLLVELYRLVRYRNKYNSAYAIPMFIVAPIDGLLGKTGKHQKYLP